MSQKLPLLIKAFSRDCNVSEKKLDLRFLDSPFVPNAPFLYPLKTSENLTVFRCFQELEKGYIWNEWVMVGIETNGLKIVIKR